MLRHAAKRAAKCSRSTHQQYKSLHLWPAKPLVEAAVYDSQRIPKPQAAGSNPAGGTSDLGLCSSHDRLLINWKTVGHGVLRLQGGRVNCTSCG
jgi:hypothetical protein